MHLHFFPWIFYPCSYNTLHLHFNIFPFPCSVLLSWIYLIFPQILTNFFLSLIAIFSPSIFPKIVRLFSFPSKRFIFTPCKFLKPNYALYSLCSLNKESISFPRPTLPCFYSLVFAHFKVLRVTKKVDVGIIETCEESQIFISKRSKNQKHPPLFPCSCPRFLLTHGVPKKLF